MQKKYYIQILIALSFISFIKKSYQCTPESSTTKDPTTSSKIITTITTKLQTTTNIFLTAIENKATENSKITPKIPSDTTIPIDTTEFITTMISSSSPSTSEESFDTTTLIDTTEFITTMIFSSSLSTSGEPFDTTEFITTMKSSSSSSTSEESFDTTTLIDTTEFITTMIFSSSLSTSEESFDTTTPIETTLLVSRESNNLLNLALNIPVRDLFNDGFVLVYDHFYSHSTTSFELDSIAASCSNDSAICVGGRHFFDSQVLSLVSCGNCLKIMNPTVLNKPILENNAYWYRTTFYSFGFGPNEVIDQNTADVYDGDSELRLSWHLDNNVGGWRLGNNTWLNFDNNFYKMIFKK